MLKQQAAGKILERIRSESSDQVRKGTEFEKLWLKLMKGMPDLDVRDAWRWRDWPKREGLTEMDAGDPGIDLVAETNDGRLIAIQCKCYDDDAQIDRAGIDSFLAISAGRPFDARWIVATCELGQNAQKAVRTAAGPPITYVDFHKYAGETISGNKVVVEKRDPWPEQQAAIDNVVNRFSDPQTDRGQLVMACGTGKTFVSLRIAERLVPSSDGASGKNILFLAPSIALVSQARREWLRHTRRTINGLVVCSDSTSGGRAAATENDDILSTELECKVTTAPDEISEHMKKTGLNVVFCTYQSLRKVCEAQAENGAPDFDLILADEAHRTTGVEPEGKEDASGFQLVHDYVRGARRLYLTATPRIYTAQSKRAMEKRGLGVFDMDDEKFGSVLHRLTFKEAVDAGRLSDYRVVVMVMRDTSIAQKLWDTYIKLTADGEGRQRVMKYDDVERLLGVALSVNGVSDARTIRGKLPRVLGFANSRWRSKIFTDLLQTRELHEVIDNLTNAPLGETHEVKHLDGTSTAYERNRALNKLNDADASRPFMINNVKLFTEGVDVPSLNAVAFIDPRDSIVDVVQAVGRVMRKTEDKSLGYIIIPVPINVDENLDDGDEITSDTVIGSDRRDPWQATRRVLRALQAHDGRLPEDPARFIDIAGPPNTIQEALPDKIVTGIQDTLKLEGLTEKFYTTVVQGSGIAKPGQMVTDDIEWRAGVVGRTFDKYGDLRDRLAKALEVESDKATCKIAALLLINACLLYSRLQPKIDGLATLSDINGSVDPFGMLAAQWIKILKDDYAPVFEPALSVLLTLPQNDKQVKDALYGILDGANKTAESLSELGYDHAGPLYHKILGTATSDSANYTDNVSALMLARLAFAPDFADWADTEGIGRLRIMDPACGTGTLLMAALKTIKDRSGYAQMPPEEQEALHKGLVEDVVYGLDINKHAIQLAACNLTLGAPTVDYKRMNLHPLPHGPQDDGSVRAGSVEILADASEHQVQKTFVEPSKDSARHGNTQLDRSGKKFPISDLDVVIMNPPFGSNQHRNRKYAASVVKRMQRNELEIRGKLRGYDQEAAETIDTNSISTFFTPLADRLVHPKRGVLAKVLPVTACTNTSGLGERKFLAGRFHIERIITSHDPKHPNFSYKTGIHECLIVCRRHAGKGGGVGRRQNSYHSKGCRETRRRQSNR